VFFTRIYSAADPERAATEPLDLRRPHQRPWVTKKDRPLTPEHFAELRSASARANGRANARRAIPASTGWLGVTAGASHHLRGPQRNFKLDGFKWLKTRLADSDDMPNRRSGRDAITELRAAVEISARLVALENGNGTGNSKRGRDEQGQTNPAAA